jgi:hypothetical protein
VGGVLSAAVTVAGGFYVAACFPSYGVGAADAGSEAASQGACSAFTTTEGCYSCCSQLDGGDIGFFMGDLHTCACGTECRADCPMYCATSGNADIPDCDICIYFSTYSASGACRDAGVAASHASAGAEAIYRCIATCPAPSDSQCAQLSTLRGCYDCCEGKHPAATTELFGAGPHDCVCDAGCAAPCSKYCPGLSVDQGACTRCALDSLVDGGCAGTGRSVCASSECQAVVACMQLCAQPS